MHRKRAVVFLCQKSHVAGLRHFGEASREIHHTQREAAGAILEPLLHNVQHPLLLFGLQLAALIAGHAGAGTAMAHQSRDVARHLAVDGLEERFDRGIHARFIVAVAEKTATDLVHVGRISLKTYGGKAAVAGYERCCTLPDKRLKIFERLFLYGKPIVVRMGIKKSGGEAQPAEINGLFCSFFQVRANGRYYIVFHQDIAHERLTTGAVIDLSVFE